MIVTTKLSMDMTNGALPQVVDVMQDDTYSRDIQITLHAGGKPLALEEVTGLLIRYQKADGTYGFYDTMPDGSCAWEIEANVVTVRLAPQTCTCPGRVKLSVSLMQEQIQLSCFEILLQVKPLPNGKLISETYVSAAAFVPLPENAQVGQFLAVRQVDDSGRVTGLQAVTQLPSGATFTPRVDEAGNLTWTNDKGLENPAAVSIMGAAGEKGEKGEKGDRGEQGAAGADGYTPVKGADYFTAADKTEMVNAVLAALPTYHGEVI